MLPLASKHICSTEKSWHKKRGQQRWPYVMAETQHCNKSSSALTSFLQECEGKKAGANVPRLFHPHASICRWRGFQKAPSFQPNGTKPLIACSHTEFSGMRLHGSCQKTLQSSYRSKEIGITQIHPGDLQMKALLLPVLDISHPLGWSVLFQMRLIMI